MVMGASPALKPVMVCGTPSSVILKFSFFNPISKSPFFVVATASTVTIGASTAMVTPACGGACAAGFCSVGAFCGGCEPLCGPVGDCARNPNAAANNSVVVAIPANNLRMYIAFMPTLSGTPGACFRTPSHQTGRLAPHYLNLTDLQRRPAPPEFAAGSYPYQV